MNAVCVYGLRLWYSHSINKSSFMIKPHGNPSHRLHILSIKGLHMWRRRGKLWSVCLWNTLFAVVSSTFTDTVSSESVADEAGWTGAGLSAERAETSRAAGWKTHGTHTLIICTTIMCGHISHQVLFCDVSGFILIWNLERYEAQLSD